jgi:hypothetical protein
MQETSKKIPFEIHLTTKNLSNEQISDFESICNDLKGKAILIELSRGKVAKQPIFTKTLELQTSQMALVNAKKYAAQFTNNNFPISRVKIEIPYQFVNKTQISKKNNQKTYFEWHGKIKPLEIKNLSQVCEKHAVHLSKNSLKGEENKKFLTMREYGTKELFEQRLNKLKKNLMNSGGILYKEETEYCIYDSNVILDEGWLSE